MNAWGYIALGIIAAFLGGIGLTAMGVDGPAWGALLAGALTLGGSVLLAIGVIAEGVRIGNRDSD